MTDADLILAAARETRLRMKEFMEGKPNPQGHAMQPVAFVSVVQCYGLIDLLVQELEVQMAGRSAVPAHPDVPTIVPIDAPRMPFLSSVATFLFGALAGLVVCTLLALLVHR